MSHVQAKDLKKNLKAVLKLDKKRAKRAAKEHAEYEKAVAKEQKIAAAAATKAAPRASAAAQHALATVEELPQDTQLAHVPVVELYEVGFQAWFGAFVYHRFCAVCLPEALMAPFHR